MGEMADWLIEQDEQGSLRKVGKKSRRRGGKRLERRQTSQRARRIRDNKIEGDLLIIGVALERERDDD